MKITTRPVCDGDRQRSIWIEAGAIQGIKYIDDVWEMFTKSGDGELIGAFLDGELGGIGKFTNLYGTYGWLEVLRVHPDYQGKGLGNAIYLRYMELMEEMNVNAVGMYTGVDNVVSRRLAEKYGLSLRGTFSEYSLDLDAKQGKRDQGGFQQVSPEKGEALLSACYEDMGDFVVINRTFYPVKAGLGECFAKNGWLYKDNAGNLAVLGYRFQPEKLTHLPYYRGDFEKVLNFALYQAEKNNSAAVSAIRNIESVEKIEELTAHKFSHVTDVITLWRGI